MLHRRTVLMFLFASMLAEPLALLRPDFALARNGGNNSDDGGDGGDGGDNSDSGDDSGDDSSDSGDNSSDSGDDGSNSPDDSGKDNNSGAKNKKVDDGNGLNLKRFGTLIPLKAALKIATSAYTGKVIDVSIVTTLGHPYYKMKIRRDDGIIKSVKLDAKTGKFAGIFGF